MGLMKMLIEVTKIDENADVPGGNFEIPVDIKFK